MDLRVGVGEGAVVADIMTIERVKWALFAGALALNPAVNQGNIHETICVPGWTKSVRPTAQELRPIKDRLMAETGASDPQPYQLDHLVPLELGGDWRTQTTAPGSTAPPPRSWSKASAAAD
jgi:hypothetical protein